MKDTGTNARKKGKPENVDGPKALSSVLTPDTYSSSLQRESIYL